MKFSGGLGGLGLGSVSLLVVGLASGCAESKATTPTAPPPPTVMVAPVVRQDVPLFIEAVGSIDGFVDADIRARVRGVLQSQRYKDGAMVQKGQLLFTIDPMEFQIAADSARAAVARAETAQAHNKALLERRTDLGAAKVVSKQEVEDAEAAARDAEDQVHLATAQLRQAALNLSYTEIRSPVTGIAGLARVRSRQPGRAGRADAAHHGLAARSDPRQLPDERDRLREGARSGSSGSTGATSPGRRPQFEKLGQGRAHEAPDELELVLADGSTYPHRGVIVAVEPADRCDDRHDPAAGAVSQPGQRCSAPANTGACACGVSDAGGNVLVVPERALIQVQGTYSARRGRAG